MKHRQNLYLAEFNLRDFMYVLGIDPKEPASCALTVGEMYAMRVGRSEVGASVACLVAGAERERRASRSRRRARRQPVPEGWREVPTVGLHAFSLTEAKLTTAQLAG